MELQRLNLDLNQRLQGHLTCPLQLFIAIVIE